ncbi:MAG: VWA domain-containing protein [Phycisphaerales bacterium]
MTFAHTSLLVAGLAAAAIPVLIHLLFRRRRPPMAWAAMDILLAALRRQERRLRLEQLLLLAARCLLFGLAGAALAKPTLEAIGAIGGGHRVVTIVLDDGAASAARTNASDSHSSAFERLRDEAATLARGLQPGDAVAVVLASKPARSLVAPATSDREAVARAIESLEPSAAATELGTALAIAGQTGGGPSDAERDIVVLSEFRLGSLDPSLPRPAAPTSGGSAPRLLARTPVDDDVANVIVASVEPQRSIDDDSITVAVRLDRSGGTNPPQAVRVAIDGDGIAPVASKQARFDAGQASARVEFVTRPLNGGAAVSVGRIIARIDDDRMPLDDVRYVNFDARSATRVGIIARRSFGAGADLEQVPASRWLTRALAPVDQPGLEVSEIEPAAVDARSLRDIDVLFVPRPETLANDAWPTLRTFTDRGGLLVLMPSAETDSQAWIERFAATFGFPWQMASDAPALAQPLGFAAEQPQSGLFSAVDAELQDLLRPVEVQRRVEVRGAAPSDVALVLGDGSPFLLIGTPASSGNVPSHGLVALLTAAPELSWTNLPVKPLMVPFAQELVRRSLVRIGYGSRVAVGDKPPAPRDAVEFVASTGTRVGVDPSTGAASGPLTTPGVWTAVDASGRAVGGVAANVDLLATRTTPQSSESIAEWLGGAGTATFVESGAILAQLSGGPQGLGVGFWILAIVAALAIVESAMARLFSHAAVVRGATRDVGVTPTALGGMTGDRPEAAA